MRGREGGREGLALDSLWLLKVVGIASFQKCREMSSARKRADTVRAASRVALSSCYSLFDFSFSFSSESAHSVYTYVYGMLALWEEYSITE